MRTLFLVIALLATACSSSDMIVTQLEDLRFKAGQKVSVSIPFYSGCTGFIVGYHKYKERKDRPHYVVKLDCPNFAEYQEVAIHESSLMARE